MLKLRFGLFSLLSRSTLQKPIQNAFPRAIVAAFSTEASSVPIDEGVQVGKPKELNIRKFKPITPGLRHLRQLVNDHLWKKGPHRALTVTKRKTGGRNHTGKITMRHIGGGHKQRIRLVDFIRKKPGSQRVLRIEYDPGRSAHIALLEHFETKEKSYILACEDLRAGDVVESLTHLKKPASGDNIIQGLDNGQFFVEKVKRGNCLPLWAIPTGTAIYGISLEQGGKAKLCRSAGSYGRITSIYDDKYLVVKLQSGEERRVLQTASATIGRVSNINWQHRKLGKAGRSRWLGIRPTVRGMAMNACDHPHGGGGGKSIGNKPPQSPWGVLAKGFRTRKGRHKNKMIVKGRPRGKKNKR